MTQTRTMPRRSRQRYLHIWPYPSRMLLSELMVEGTADRTPSNQWWTQETYLKVRRMRWSNVSRLRSRRCDSMFSLITPSWEIKAKRECRRWCCWAVESWRRWRRAESALTTTIPRCHILTALREVVAYRKARAIQWACRSLRYRGEKDLKLSKLSISFLASDVSTLNLR